MLVIAAPGQGAQKPGFLLPWLELPGVAERIDTWSELIGCDLIRFGSNGTADEIKDTAVAQPLLVAAALAAAAAIGVGDHADSIVAGHSVGELAAGVMAGIITAQDAISLVGVRGQAMAQAADAMQTSMTAVLGGDEATVLASIETHGLTPANINGAGQIVAAGTVDQLAAFAADPPPSARLIKLQVAGAFHTEHMAPAVTALREAAAGVTVHDPMLTVLSNKDGAAVRTGSDWLERMCMQVSSPVRWDSCMATMRKMGATAFIELPPAGTLTGLAKRALPGVQVLAVKSPANLDAARAMLAEHSAGHIDHDAPDWRLLVAPQAGTFMSAVLPDGPGTRVASGTELGRVEMRGGTTPVVAGFPATIIEWLVEDGDPVNLGQPLVRLEPESRLASGTEERQQH